MVFFRYFYNVKNGITIKKLWNPLKFFFNFFEQKYTTKKQIFLAFLFTTSNRKIISELFLESVCPVSPTFFANCKVEEFDYKNENGQRNLLIYIVLIQKIKSMQDININGIW